MDSFVVSVVTLFETMSQQFCCRLQVTDVLPHPLNPSIKATSPTLDSVALPRTVHTYL